MKRLVPVRTHSSPCRSARVWRAAASEPASGSVRAKAGTRPPPRRAPGAGGGPRGGPPAPALPAAPHGPARRGHVADERRLPLGDGEQGERVLDRPVVSHPELAPVDRGKGPPREERLA